MDFRRVGLKLALIFSHVALAVSFCVAIHAQASILDRLAGTDLWKHRPTKQELAQLQQLVGSAPKGFMMEPNPWHIWKLDRNRQTRYVVLLGEDLGIIPGGTSACVQLFDGTLKRYQSWPFQTGWRNILIDASVEHTTELGTDLLVIHTVKVINGRDIAKEYFAIGDDRLRLVRLEDSTGEIRQNEYVFPNYEIGTVPSAQTIQGWTALLVSKDKSDVLSALVFLGGRHLAEDRRLLLPEPHESKYAALFQQLLSSQPVYSLIDQLSKSENVWIRDAAALAARGPRERPLD